MAASVVVIDQVTKVAAAHGGSAMVLPARNPAYALGIVGGPAPLLIVGSAVVLVAFLVMVDGLASRFEIPALLPALVAGGMIGNMLDRIRFGAARDFLVTPWAIVNLADFAVAIGVIGLVIAIASRAPRLRTQQFAATAR